MKKVFIITMLISASLNYAVFAQEAKMAEDYRRDAVRLIGEKKYKEALVLLEKSARFDQNNAQIHNDIGGVYYMLNRPDDAKKELLKATEINPVYKEAYYNLASICIKQENTDDAIKYSNKAIELGFDNPNIYAILGKAYFHKKLFNESLQNYEKLLPSRPGDPNVHFMLGLLYASIRDSDKAKKEYAATLELDPSHKAARQELKKLEELH